MPTILFMRHGESETNAAGILTGRTDAHLSPKGRADAQKVGASMKADYDYYFCSPLIRTQETMREVMGDVPFTVDPRIIEVYPGIWQGMKMDELPEPDVTLYRKGLLDPPGGEKLSEVDDRIRSFLRDMFDGRYRAEDRIFVVCHNALLRSMKRMFVDPATVVPPKNLETFTVDDRMYHEKFG